MINTLTLLNTALQLGTIKVQANHYQHIIKCVKNVLPSDATALLICQDNVLKPVAIDGLMPDTLGRRFVINNHPRLHAICDSSQPLKFAQDCPLPDPYDGLLISQKGDIPVHACLGMPLLEGDTLLGVITLDSLNAHAFDELDLPQLTVLSQLCAAQLKTALLLQQYQHHAQHSHALVQELNREALTRDGVEIIGHSPAIKTLRNDIKLVAGSEFSVLIQGDTGVGKELVARNIHLHSKRSQQPLIHLNCASLPENLAESEFFGHAKGAFTGAENARQGKFQLADGGTLFLDEIGELPLTMQSKLLRVLQSGEIQTLGEDKIKYVDVRVIAATNRNLKDEVAQGRFRADLYHRLSVYPLHVPTLKQRENDVVLLAGFFIEKTARKLAIKQLKLSVEAQLTLTQYSWPGNVRELEHVISRAALKAKQSQWQQAIITIEAEHCELNLNTQTQALLTTPTTVSENSPQLSLKQATDTFTHNLVSQQLEQHNFNWAATARTLCVDRANLIRLAKRLGIKVKKSL